MSAPIYCRTTGLRISLCACYRCQSRTVEEVRDWNSYTPEQRKAAALAAKERRK